MTKQSVRFSQTARISSFKNRFSDDVFDPLESAKTRFNITRPDSTSLPTYGEESIAKLIARYGEGRSAETEDGGKTVKAAMIIHLTYIHMYIPSGNTFRHLLVKQPQDGTSSQLKELVSCSRQCFPICIRLPPSA